MNKVKKIAWVLHGAYRNEGRVYKESQSLANAGYEVTIFAMWEPGLSLVQHEGKVRIERLPFTLLKALGIYYRDKVQLFMPFYTLKLLFRLWRYKPNIVHCMNFWTLHIGYLSNKLFKIPYIYDSHDLFIGQNHMNNKPPIIRRLYMMCENFFAKRAVAVIQTSESRSAQFWEFYGIKAKVIMNKALASTLGNTGLNLGEYPGLKTSKSKLVYVGSVIPHRGLEQLIEATSDMDNIQIFLLGPPGGKYSEKLLDKYKGLVVYIPPVPPAEVSEALKYFDMGVSLIQNSCLSYYLECPTKVWELISSGTPQIASDLPEIRKAIIDNKVGPVGRVVDPADISQIRRNIQEMLNNPGELEMYRKNCIKLRELCSWELESEKLLNLYNLLRGIA